MSATLIANFDNSSILNDSSSVNSLPFPPEVTVTILGNLHVKDVLMIRQVCKTLHDATLSRGLWASLFRNCYSRSLPRPPLLEKTFSSYTARQLEENITKRIRRIEMRKATSKCTPKATQLFTMFDQAPAPILIRGGRWLLYFPEGEPIVHVLDLESPSLAPEILCDVRREEIAEIESRRGYQIGQGDVVAMMMDQVEEPPPLHFNLLIGLRPGNNAVFQVWKVSLVEHGRESKLKAEHLKTLVVPGFGNITRVDVFAKNYIVFHDFVTPTNRIEGSLLVIDWMESTSSHLSAVSCRIPRGYSHGAHLLPNNRILCFMRERILMCGIPDLKLIPKSSLPAGIPVSPNGPLWEIPFASPFMERNLMSPLDVRQDMSKVYICSTDGIYELPLRHDDPTTPPQLSQLISFPERFRHPSSEVARNDLEVPPDDHSEDSADSSDDHSADPSEGHPAFLPHDFSDEFSWSVVKIGLSNAYIQVRERRITQTRFAFYEGSEFAEDSLLPQETEEHPHEKWDPRWRVFDHPLKDHRSTSDVFYDDDSGRLLLSQYPDTDEDDEDFDDEVVAVHLLQDQID